MADTKRACHFLYFPIYRDTEFRAADKALCALKLFLVLIARAVEIRCHFKETHYILVCLKIHFIFYLVPLRDGEEFLLHIRFGVFIRYIIDKLF